MCFWLYFIIISYNIDIKYENKNNTGESKRVVRGKGGGGGVVEMLQSI